MARFSGAKWALAAAIGLGAAALSAQPPRPGDPIAEARARQQIADQKATADVAGALSEADRAARVSPVKAARQLRDTLVAVNGAVSVSPETRQVLATALNTRIAALEGRGALAPPAPTTNTGRDGQKAEREKWAAEVKAVQESLAKIADYRQRNRFAEANAEVSRITALYPTNPASLVLNTKGNFESAVADARTLTDLQGKRMVANLNSVQRSATAPVGDIEFPPNWKELSERRLKAQPDVTAKEKAILEALDRPMTIAVEGKPLGETLQIFSNEMNQNILVDPRSLADAQLDLQKPVAVAGRNLSARTILRQLLASQGLTFVVKDEAIQVVTVDRARDMLVTKAYYLGDIVQGVGPLGGGGAVWGPFADYQQTLNNVNAVMEAITGSVEPLSWRGKGGGAGTITFHYPSMSLIVRQSAEVHSVLGSKFGRGK